jgi:YegS/Rv2252/BmrU family lipid kinase
VAGNSHADQLRQLFQQQCDNAAATFEVYETSGEDRLDEVIARAEANGCTLVVAVGGDGTVSEVANELAGKNLPLGILPAGTGNLLAQELGIPLNLKQACQLVMAPTKTTQLDAMRVGDQFFVSHISLGVYSRIIENTAVSAKRRYGKAAYLWQMFREIVGGQGWRFGLTIDGEKHHVLASLVMVANIGTVGVGQLRWGEDIRPDDGRIDVCVVLARTLPQYIEMLRHVWRGEAPPPQHMRTFQAREQIGITANKPLPLRADGEIIGNAAVSVMVHPQAITVITPQ